MVASSQSQPNTGPGSTVASADTPSELSPFAPTNFGVSCHLLNAAVDRVAPILPLHAYARRLCWWPQWLFRGPCCVNRLSRGNGVASRLRGTLAKFLFVILGEMTVITHTDLEHHLLDAPKRFLQKLARPSQTQSPHIPAE